MCVSQEAEKMVASLQDTSLEEERFTQALQENHGVGVGVGAGAGASVPGHSHPHTHQTAAAAAAATATHPHGHPHSTPSHSLAHPASALPLSHEAAMKWFYKDPQGEIQGGTHTLLFSPSRKRVDVCRTHTNTHTLTLAHSFIQS